jgi:hypothetical protein
MYFEKGTTFRRRVLLARQLLDGFLLGLAIEPEDRGDMLLQCFGGQHVSCWIIALFTLRSRKWKQHVPPTFRKRIHFLLVSWFVYSSTPYDGGGMFLRSLEGVCFFCWVLGWFTRLPWRWKRYVPPKQWALQELHGVTTIVNAEKTSICTKLFYITRKYLKTGTSFILTGKVWCHLHPRKQKTCLWRLIRVGASVQMATAQINRYDWRITLYTLQTRFLNLHKTTYYV